MINKVAETVRTESVVLEIEGLTSNHDGSFTLDGVQQIHIDYPAIDRILRDAGVPEVIVLVQTEQFAKNMSQALFADALAQRIRRIG